MHRNSWAEIYNVIWEIPDRIYYELIQALRPVIKACNNAFHLAGFKRFVKFRPAS